VDEEGEILKKIKDKDQYKIKKNLEFIENPIMDDRIVEIVSYETSIDWYI